MSVALTRITTLFDYFLLPIRLLFEPLTALFSHLADWLAFFSTATIYVPDIVKPFIIMGIAISIYLMVLGRN